MANTSTTITARPRMIPALSGVVPKRDANACAMPSNGSMVLRVGERCPPGSRPERAWWRGALHPGLRLAEEHRDDAEQDRGADHQGNHDDEDRPEGRLVRRVVPEGRGQHGEEGRDDQNEHHDADEERGPLRRVQAPLRGELVAEEPHPRGEVVACRHEGEEDGDEVESHVCTTLTSDS